MPRISYPSSASWRGASDWERSHDLDLEPLNENLNLCHRCARMNATDQEVIGKLRKASLIPAEVTDNWVSVGEEHPPYDDTDYSCDLCKRSLSGLDD
jgi:hypothetical protein